MKKFLPLAVVLLLAILAIVGARAYQSGLLDAYLGSHDYLRLLDDSFDAAERGQVKKEVLALRKHNVLTANAEELVAIAKTPDSPYGAYCYTIQVGQYTNEIWVTENTAKRVAARITQDDIVNGMVFEGKKVYINGKEVTARNAG